jgi:hypothetical protein
MTSSPSHLEDAFAQETKDFVGAQNEVRSFYVDLPTP